MAIEIETSAGKKCRGHLAEAKDARGNLVLIHDWWGFDFHVDALIKRFAEEGYRTIAPDLYHGLMTTSPSVARHKMGLISFDESMENVRGAVRHVQSSAKLAVLGFGMGGSYALALATATPELSAAITFYAVPDDRTGNAETIKSPLLAHFANQDESVSQEGISAFEATLKKTGALHQFQTYDAKRGFFDDGKKDSYNEEAARLAWGRTIAFLRERVG
jgi:carboxymethylenebutenolidase